jgi:hypothetical protein
MDTYFDIFNQYNPPAVLLCNPNKEVLYSIGKIIYDTKLTLRFNAISEFEFTLPQSTDNYATTIEAYQYIKTKRLILIDGIGYFVINEAKEVGEGNTYTVEVKCESLESELTFRKVTGLQGTFKFAGTLSQADLEAGVFQMTLMDYVVSLVPNWTLGDVDVALVSKYRTFEIDDTTLYGFLMTDVETAYSCIFYFDIINRVISVKANTNPQATPDTDIYLSFNNLLKSTDFSEISDEIVTALSVYGANQIDIRSVNPLGTNYIYNFDYYKNTNWMSQELVDAITAWEVKVTSQSATYSALLQTIMNANLLIAGYDVELQTLQGEYSQLEIDLKVAIELKMSTTQINADMVAKQAQITAKQAEITVQQDIVDGALAQANDINEDLSFDNLSNFDASQRLELDVYIFENTYQDEYISITDSMKPPQIQSITQELYDKGVAVLDLASEPRYEFSVDVANFITLSGYTEFTNQLVMGSLVHIEKDETAPIQAVLLEVEFSFDKPEEASLTFSNRLRIDDAGFKFTDLFGQVVKTGASVSFGKLNWSDWNNNYKDDVSTFITSSLDTTRNALINSSNQEIVINGAGLRGARYLPNTQTYDPNQVWLTSNVLAFTNDNWATVKTALGETTYDGQTRFGLVGEVIVGNILAGNALTISNSGGNFLLDESGATLRNASFTLANTSAQRTIKIDPNIGVKMYNNANPSNPMFFADIMTGNVIVKGNITATTGTIGGWTITTEGFVSGSNYIKSTGFIKLGGLYITPTSNEFDGNVFAARVQGVLASETIPNLSAGKITSGYMSANRIYGGVISWGGGTIGTQGGGAPAVNVSGNFQINASTITLGASSYVAGGLEVYGTITADSTISSHAITMNGYSLSNASSITASGQIRGGTVRSDGAFNYNGSSGLTRTIGYVKSAGGNGTLQFSGGILTSSS